ncbi:MAG: TRAP transporter substrate-binding protein [Butyrivibrio sp.]|nr:TRAP transporter substrate-binding protein [Butyrivibrio sp.]MBQ8031867.1 TRAP transporter substrate-binding protein [Butyrivibrio sp.]MBR1641190.1 TRAP transporter substrate-binding protein [Butyrivibrio sp.]
MKRRFLSVVLTAAMVLSMTACGVSAPEAPAQAPAAEAPAAEAPAAEAPAAEAAVEPAADAITLVMAEVNPLDTIVGMTDQKFKEEVESRSNGSIIIDLQASGVLGSENDVLDSMLGGGGTIDMSRISAFALTSYGGQKSMLLSLPYIFTSREHFWNFATSDLAQEFLQEPSENGSGVRGLFYGEEGFRHFFTVNEVKDITSFKGMKLRVSNDPIMNGLVEGLGASPTVVSFGELYSALQTGVVDGAEQPIANYKSNAFPEVAPYMILDGHTLGAIQVIITDEAWNKLSADQQQILMDAGKAASEYNRSISESKEKEVLDELKADGVNIIEVDDITPWQEAVKPVIEENIKGLEDYYQKLVDFGK